MLPPVIYDSCSLGNKTLHSCKINRTVSEQHRALFFTCFPNSCLWGCWLASYLNQRLGTNIFIPSPSDVIIKNNQKTLPIFLPHQGRFCIMPFLQWVKRQKQSLLCTFPTAANAVSQQKLPDTVKKKKQQIKPKHRTPPPPKKLKER